MMPFSAPKRGISDKPLQRAREAAAIIGTNPREPPISMQRDATMRKAKYIQTMEHAAQVAGGYERLAGTLGVSGDELQRWMEGSTAPRPLLFLRVLDLVLNDLEGQTGRGKLP
jgi:hypothetical protein